MSHQEKRHRSSMQHLRYLNSFMDEIDREVMSLTDRAFKSLCIGDEAIYNDSEFSPSPVSCHKPVVEDISKKTQEDSFSAVKNLQSYPLNGATEPLSRSNKSSKDLSLFAVFTAKKNGDGTKMTNGDSWDKSALLSIQRELSEFSTDYHSLAVKRLSQGKNTLKSDSRSEKGSGKKSSKDASIPSGKSFKGKRNKLTKLNCINFFLHSEFSPFLSWRDFNQFSIGREHISEIMLANGPPEWYDSPLYKELTGHFKLPFPLESKKEAEKGPEKIETHPVKTLPAPEPPKPEVEARQTQHIIPTKAPVLATEQRCNSERTEPCVPWRKNRNRAKSAAPMGSDRTVGGEGSAQAFKKEVKTVDDQASASSTPFSISQLLTPVIPSRHGTGTSEIMLSPTALDVPSLPERDLHPSPEIKREGYKSIASSLLFNLKDNRKRVKTMYSPPKFRGLDVANPSKESPQTEVSKDGLEIPEVSGAKTISPARQKAIISPMSPLMETADAKTSSPAGGGVPDDYLALSLLQSGKLKSNQSPSANKAPYPSLKLYRKPEVLQESPEEVHIRADAQATVETSSQVFTNETGKVHGTEHSKQCNAVDMKSKNNPHNNNNNPLDAVLNVKNPDVGLNIEKSVDKKIGKSPSVSLTNLEEQPIRDGTNHIKEALKTRGIVNAEKSPVKEKEMRAKHVFSARQNNYIKIQRFVSMEENNDHANEGPLTLSHNDDNEQSRHSKNTKTNAMRHEKHKTSAHKVLAQTTVDGALLKGSGHESGESTTAKDQRSMASKSGLEAENKTQKEQKGNSETMKGNTFAKRALFASMEKVPNKTNAPFKKDNAIMDKYDLAKIALEEVIAEREQRKSKAKVVDGKVAQDVIEIPSSGEAQLFSMFEREKCAKNGKDHNTASAFKTNWQTVQKMSEDIAKHGEGHVPEVKLAWPCKQETSIGQCQHAEATNYNETDRLPLENQEIKAEDVRKDETIRQMKEQMNTNTGRAKKCNVIQCEEELSVDKKPASYKPEIPPRRGRSNSQSNDGIGERTDFKRCDTKVNPKETESREVSKVQSKDRGPMRGNVSALKEKYDKDSKVNLKDVLKGQSVVDKGGEKSVEEESNEKSQKMKPPKLTVSDPESRTFSIVYKENVSESEGLSHSSLEESEEHSRSKRKPSVTQILQAASSDPANKVHEEIAGNKVKSKEKEESAVSLKDKSKGPSKSYMKDLLSGLLGLAISERGRPEDEHEEEPSETLYSESFKSDKARKDSITVHDILGQSHSGKQTRLSSRSSNSSELSKTFHESQQGAQPDELLRKIEVLKESVDEKVKEDFHSLTIETCALSNLESESDISDGELSPLNDVDKKGWVQSLIESARDLTQISHSHSQDELEVAEEMSQNEHFNGPEKEDQDYSPVGTSVKSPQPNQSAMHFLSLPTAHLDKEGKLSTASLSEEEERRSAVSTLSEGLDSYETGGGDMMEDNISSTADKASGERSASSCSGHDSNSQNKPPVVPPKTEKALRRAMKLTTRRIQKAEAKSKSDRKGRSNDKSHKAERRHHNTDKALERSEHRSLSSDRVSSKHGEHLDLKETKTQGSDKHSGRQSDPKSQTIEEKDPSKEMHHATKDKHAKSNRIEKQSDDTSNLEGIPDGNKSVRAGRSNEKRFPMKLERRTQSLDRFLRDTYDSLSIYNGRNGGEVNSEGSQYSNPKALPSRQSSVEGTYGPAANLVTQSFPMTQRKLLQDPDSGQFFLVEMPVQVKTKTFFDPETKSYVQLPVQSPEATAALEVMSTPPLMVYHGFVPVPVPSQKTCVGSMIPPDDFELSGKEMLEDFYQTHNEEVNPYIESVYISQEHTPEEEIASVR